MFVLKLIIILSALSVGTMVLIMYTSSILEDKPKTNKFRQWWTKHIVDLDNEYDY